MCTWKWKKMLIVLEKIKHFLLTVDKISCHFWQLLIPRTKIDSISSCKALTIDMIQNEPYHRKPREYDTKASPKHWKESVNREWLCIPETFIFKYNGCFAKSTFFRNWIVCESQKKFQNQNFFSVQMVSKNVFWKMQINKSYVILEQIIILCFKSTVRIGSVQICEF